jgi:hypothetical protein
MRSPFDSFDEAVSKQGSSTIGRTDFINHAQGMEMAGNANRQQALRRANQYQIEANEAKAEAGMPSSGNDVYQSSSFSAGDGGVSAVDSFDTSGIDFGGLF